MPTRASDKLNSDPKIRTKLREKQRPNAHKRATYPTGSLDNNSIHCAGMVAPPQKGPVITILIPISPVANSMKIMLNPHTRAQAGAQAGASPMSAWLVSAATRPEEASWDCQHQDFRGGRQPPFGESHSALGKHDLKSSTKQGAITADTPSTAQIIGIGTLSAPSVCRDREAPPTTDAVASQQSCQPQSIE